MTSSLIKREMQSEVDKVLSHSSRAICGEFEREVVVKESKVGAVKRMLKRKGFFIVGTGDVGFGKKKIWFNPEGMTL